MILPSIVPYLTTTLVTSKFLSRKNGIFTGLKHPFPGRWHSGRHYWRRHWLVLLMTAVPVVFAKSFLGIGLTMARALAFNGARKVYILGRRLEVLKTAAQAHASLAPLQCDVTSKEDLQAAVDHITTEIGYVNLVVVNSGSIGPPVRFNPAHSLPELRKTLFTDFSMKGMNETLHLNVTAAFFTMTAFLELLDAGNRNALEGGFGRPIRAGSHVPTIQSQVIFTTSISAFSRHWSSSPPYLTSKVAIMQVTKHASTQLARFGIRVNAIAPGCKYISC